MLAVSGETLMILAKIMPYFKPSKEYRARVDFIR
jgi:nucleoid DNA-binding protein